MDNIGEGALEIPPEWNNSTINIFTEKGPDTRGLSITVNRDKLPADGTFEDYIADQEAKLPNQLAKFHLLKTESLDVDGRPARFCEFTWSAGEVGAVHQILLVVADGLKVLSFAGSCPGLMNEDQSAQVVRILRNFRFTRAAGQE